MNIAQLSEQLKDVPQNRLVDYARNPNSVVPQFLALAEIQRRQHLAAQAQPPAATVAEDVLAQAAPQPMPQQMPQQMAPQQMAQQLPENQPGVAQLPTGMPQGMASGGIVAFAGGGEADGYDDRDEEEIEDQRHKRRISSMIAGLQSRASDAVAAVPRAVAAVPKAIESAMAALPQSYEAEKAKVASGLTSFKSKGSHPLESQAISAAKEVGLDPKLMLHALYKETGGHKDPATAVSKAGAYGPMQLMEAAAKEVGVNRRDPYENLLGGARYLKKQVDTFGDDVLALAAYNAGPGRVRQMLKRGQGIESLSPETQGYVKFSQGGIASFAGDKGSDVEEDEDYVNPYLERSRGVVSGVRNLYDTMTTLKNYDLYDMYKRNIGDPFARYANKVSDSFNETPAEQAERFRSYSMTPKAEPKVGYTEPLGVNVKAPASPKVSEALQMTPAERNRYAAISGINALAPTVPAVASDVPSEKDFRDFDQAAALFQAEQQVKDLQNPPEQTGPQEVDPVKAALLRAAQEREEIKASAQTDKYLAMLQASLGMMAGTSPYAMANIGQGGMQGVAAYAAAKKQRAAELSDLNRYEARLMNTKEEAEYRKALLADKNEERKDKMQLYRDRLDEQGKRDFDAKLTRVGSLVNQHPQIKALEKRRDFEKPLPGSPQDQYYDDAIEAVRKAVYIQNGLPYEFAPVKLPAYPSPVVESKGNFITNLFGGSSKPATSGLTPGQQELLNKYNK